MKLTFRLTWDDYSESIKAHSEAALKAPIFGPGRQMPPNGVQIVGAGANPKRKSSFSRAMLGWLVILAVSVLVFVLFHEEKPRPAALPGMPVVAAPRGVNWYEIAISVAPYGVIFLVVWFAYYRYLKGIKRTQKLLDSDPEYTQERTVDVEEWGIRVSVPTHRHEYDWLAYRRVVETANLFMLYQAETEFQIVPKRAFASVEEAGRFREVVETMIGDRRNSAFPVEPAATSALPGA